MLQLGNRFRTRVFTAADHVGGVSVFTAGTSMVCQLPLQPFRLLAREDLRIAIVLERKNAEMGRCRIGTETGWHCSGDGFVLLFVLTLSIRL